MAHRPLILFSLALAAAAIAPTVGDGAPSVGYYRMPALHGDTLVFVAEGDLWRVPVTGGVAQRLTTHLDEEAHPVGELGTEREDGLEDDVDHRASLASIFPVPSGGSTT